MEPKVDPPKEMDKLFNHLKTLIDKTQSKSPQEEDIRQLRKLLKEHPELLQMTGDMALQASTHLIESVKGTEMTRHMLLHSRATRLKELGYHQAAPMEKMVIEQVVLCWLRHNLLEYEITSRAEGACTEQQRLIWEKQLNQSQQRYLRACESLARIRKLSRNTSGLQVNIAREGGQQVNVAGDLTLIRASDSKETNQKSDN